ncbi:MAG: hypothetical protein R3C26_00730 [Calditrichia bacterium]|nr:hypothetical protein [Calditrichota bacterium]MCB9066341.1 hypothetical protein [Calditrichia bacterium]
MRTFTFCFIVLLLVLVGCSGSSRLDWQKVNDNLRQEMATLAMAGDAGILTVSGKTRTDLTDSQQQSLQKIGVTIKSHSGNQFVAEGSLQQIERVAGLPFVEWLQLSR